MKTTLWLFAVLSAMYGAASAQVVPAATGPAAALAGGSVQYALRYSETAEFATTIPTMQTANVSGSLNYLSGSERRPFVMQYGGGYTWTISGPAYESGQSQRLFLSQGIDWRKWKVTVSDDASYLPQSPTTGFLGIPGIGEPIGVTNPTPASGQSILTLNTHAVENVAIGNLDHEFNLATSLNLGGEYGLLRYPNGDGLDTNTEIANAEILHHFNARNALSGTYLYSNYSYPAYNFTFESNTGMLGYEHRWTRNLTTKLAAGSEWLSSSIGTVVPSSTGVAANASVTYALPNTSASAIYTRGTNGGGGYLLGAEVDTVAANFSRQFGLNLTIGLTGGYNRTAGLSNNGTTDATFGGAQGTWRIGQNFIVFANYTGTDQSSTSALPTNALSQLLQTVGFGIGYSPRLKHVRQ